MARLLVDIEDDKVEDISLSVRAMEYVLVHKKGIARIPAVTKAAQEQREFLRKNGNTATTTASVVVPEYKVSGVQSGRESVQNKTHSMRPKGFASR